MNSPNPNFVLNIIELQNVITGSSGVNPVTYLSNQLLNIQQMVNFDSKQINVNAISNFNTSPIQVFSPLNLCNVAFTSNGVPIGTDSTTLSNIGSGSNGELYIGNVSTSLLLTQNGISSFFIDASSNATFIGSVSASNFITTSDERKKTSIRKITDYETILSSVSGVRFEWKDTLIQDVGVIAQEILPVLPEAVFNTNDGYKVAYQKFIPVLIEAVKSLQARVSLLESR